MLDQQAEGFEPGGMCQRSECGKGRVGLHASGLFDRFARVNIYRKNTMRMTDYVLSIRAAEAGPDGMP